MVQFDPQVFLIAVVVVTTLIGLMALYARNRRAEGERLRQRFGPEYDRTVRESGSQRRAEAQLASREQRVERLTLRELTQLERAQFTKRWNELQLRFVDSPKGAVSQADDLLVVLMRSRGYPMSDFEQRAADISVDHPRVVENYRTAHDITIRLRSGQASTEDLRRAMIHYRMLFDELISPPEEMQRAA